MKFEQTNKNFLDRFCIDITKLAREGSLDPIIGRHEEIRRVLHILSRRTKNNPLLLGDPGVGKTAIVEGIAQRIVSNDVPGTLKSAVIYSLDLGLLISGAKYQGEFEERLKGLLEEVSKSEKKIILFIDELHTIVGAGSGAGGALDASNMLKPALARGELHCIGATTVTEWKKYIEKDAALERRFQRISVEEPTQEDALAILRGLKERYELHHGIKIKDQALIAAVKLSSKYITDRFLPDKAIDLIDEAAAMLKMNMESYPPELDKLDRQLRQLKIEKVALSKDSDKVSKDRLAEIEKEQALLEKKYNNLNFEWKKEKEPLEKRNKLKAQIEEQELLYRIAEREGNYEKASKIRYGTLSKLEQELHELETQQAKHPHKLIKEVVDEQDIAAVVSRWTGIPAQRLSESESQKLLRMHDYLATHIIGQSEAVNAVAQTIRMHKAGLSEPNRPVGSFLFLGPTGVGKTELTKALAEFMFNDSSDIIRIDMSEYMEKHSVAKLIGAPPGYVGYEEGGRLTEALRRHPYSIILFDEFEKAHPDIWNILLQILDEGHVTDSQGRKVNAKNSVIIMTSNIGAHILQDKSLSKEEKSKEVFTELRKQIKPELINRIDSIIIFNSLSKEAMSDIVKLRLQELVSRAAEKNIALTYDKNVISWLREEGFDPDFGARPLKRIITKEIGYLLAEKILSGELKEKAHISIVDNYIQIH